MLFSVTASERRMSTGTTICAETPSRSGDSRPIPRRSECRGPEASAPDGPGCSGKTVSLETGSLQAPRVAASAAAWKNRMNLVVISYTPGWNSGFPIHQE